MKNRLKLLVWLFASQVRWQHRVYLSMVRMENCSLRYPARQPTAKCLTPSPTMESKCWNLLPWGWRQMWVISNRGLQLKEHKVTALDTVYEQSRIKASRIHYWANELLCSFVNGEGKNVQITFRVSNNDVAFRYTCRGSREKEASR